MLKKVRLLAILSLSVVFLFCSGSVFAAQGSWTSSFQFDFNGVSEVGTTNAFSETGHFTLRVVRATGQWIGHSNHTLGPHQSAANSFWGQPGLDRQGQVIINSRYWHTPWFKP
ncbi:hypothetical protein [Streptococcus ruminantium]|uniref:hypothetical protein n=1 Tax=Streptococcus ruminantium TaxID=1917441 RepID=UPI001F4912EF|nr:hypothetical protein [Streptococcus ruminantium]BDD39572.1 hypothetical protein GUT183_18100 [Streptococcus ruminantium]